MVHKFGMLSLTPPDGHTLAFNWYHAFNWYICEICTMGVECNLSSFIFTSKQHHSETADAAI